MKGQYSVSLTIQCHGRSVLTVAEGRYSVSRKVSICRGRSMFNVAEGKYSMSRKVSFQCKGRSVFSVTEG